MIVAFANQKGGCSKSTTAVHFAYWLREFKKKTVQFIDTDEQQSSSTWLQAMQLDIPVFIFKDTNAILEKIPEMESEADFLIIDSPASAQEITRAVLFISDLVIIPVQPSGIDLHSTGETIRLVCQAQQVRKGENKPKAATFLTRAVNRTRLKHEAIDFLSEVPDIKILETVVHQRIAVADTFGQDSVIWDFPKANAAQTEFEHLFKEIWKLVK